MPDVTINQAIGQSENTGDAVPEMDSVEPVPQSRGLGIDLSFLKNQTGEGDISDYLDHPLNFNNSKGMARVLRGLTGMIGNMNYAIVDIFIGALDFMKGKGKNAA